MQVSGHRRGCRSSVRSALAVALLLGAVASQAQTITTVPVSVAPAVIAPVPINGVWTMLGLGLALLAAGAWLIGTGRVKRAGQTMLCLVATACMAAALGYNPVASAQQLLSMLSFTQPGGETLDIPIVATPASGMPTAFNAVEFKNASGSKLKISQLVPPESQTACFPAGILSPLPGASAPVGATACSVDLELEKDAVCVVDVATMCAQTVSALSISPAVGAFLANGAIDITVTANPSSSQPARNVTAIIPGSSGLMVQSSTCAAALAPGASCVITLTGSTAEGPTVVSIAGDNTSAATTSVTVNWPAPVLSATSPALCNSTGAGVLKLTGSSLLHVSDVRLNGAAAPSFTALSDSEVVATLPAGWTGGNVSITLTTSGGTSQPLVKQFDVPVEPQSCGIDPGSSRPAMFSKIGFTQVTGTTAGCVLCSVMNPSLSVDDDAETYSQLSVPVGLIGGSVYQHLIFNQAPMGTRRIGVIIGDGDGLPIGSDSGKLQNIKIALMSQWNEVVYSTIDTAQLLDIPGLPAGSTQKMWVMDMPANQLIDRVAVTLLATGGGTTSLQVYGGVIEQTVQ